MISNAIHNILGHETTNRNDSRGEHEISRKSSHLVLDGGEQIGMSSKYWICQAIGKGRYSTVYSAVMSPLNAGPYDMERQSKQMVGGGDVAIKVYRNSPGINKYFDNEVGILRHIHAADTMPHIISIIDTFVITSPTLGMEHQCLVMNLGDMTLTKLLDRYAKAGSSGLPLNIVKKLARDIFLGLTYIHSVGVIHADIKPCNIILRCDAVDVMNRGTTIQAVITDFGNAARTVESLCSGRPGTLEYIPPELVIGMKYDRSVDVWAACAVLYELITGDILFDVTNQYDSYYGEDVADLWPAEPTGSSDGSSSGSSSSDASGSNSESSGSNDEGSSKSSGSNSSGSDEDQYYYMLLVIMDKLAGPPSQEFAVAARPYYNRRGLLTYHPNISRLSISDLIVSRMDNIEPDVATLAGDLISQGIKHSPQHRAQAVDIAYAHWLMQ